MPEFEIRITGEARKAIEEAAEKSGRSVEREIAVGIAAGVVIMRDLQEQNSAGVEAKLSIVDSRTNQVAKNLPSL